MNFEEVRNIIKESPLFEKWGSEDDIIEIFERVKKYIDPFKITNRNYEEEVGEVYAGH